MQKRKVMVILSVELVQTRHFRLMLGIMSGRSVDYPSLSLGLISLDCLGIDGDDDDENDDDEIPGGNDMIEWI